MGGQEIMAPEGLGQLTTEASGRLPNYPRPSARGRIPGRYLLDEFGQ